jgi:hypothetical protein
MHGQYNNWKVKCCSYHAEEDCKGTLTQCADGIRLSIYERNCNAVCCRCQAEGWHSGTVTQCAADINLRGAAVELHRSVLQVSGWGLTQWNCNAVCFRCQAEAWHSGTGTQCAAGISVRGVAPGTRHIYVKICLQNYSSDFRGLAAILSSWLWHGLLLCLITYASQWNTPFVLSVLKLEVVNHLQNTRCYNP